MEVGVCLPQYRGPAAEPGFLARSPKMLEDLGYASIWVTEHIIIPFSHIPQFGKIFYEPLTTLAFAAAQTERVKLGTSITVVPMRNPIILAKELATIDQLSNGRLIFGAAVGWMQREFAFLNAEFKDRGKRANEYLDIIKTLWTQVNPEFVGEYFKFGDIAFLPKPVQQPYPPIWIGGNSIYAQRRAVHYGNAWHPSGISFEELAEGIRTIHHLNHEAGKPEDSTTITVRRRLHSLGGAHPEHVPQIERRALGGSVEDVLEDIRTLEEIGVSHIVLDIPAATAAEYTQIVEGFAREVLPKLTSVR